MNFNGFQKLTLLDYPGKVACTLFTAGCNLRCPFCHNASLVTHIDNTNIYKKEEILSYLKKRQGILEGVCISGGEPLLQPDIEDFICEVKAIGYKVKLDTNGFYPDKLISLVNKGLIDYVAVDFKNTYEKYPQTTGIENLDISPFKKTVEFLLCGSVDYEFRTTVVKGIHETQDIVEIAKTIKDAPRYFLQSFVDSGDLIANGLCAISPEDMKKMALLATQFVTNTKIRGI
ncbi:MAG: anaerobic ribonucleoside-triphosphate reductase activating protein [Ruminococcaceae bacterium]|nr:anaerobic ribonucleoside-triphosphate reductase activating protein [Oscillospiraceae bacterium]